jgi:hypothetical protein
MHPQSITRFWSHVHRSEAGCWLWTGFTDPATGYGWCTIERRHLSVHRVAWEIATGAPPDRDVLHTCDNRACVRNDEPGTYAVEGIALPRYGHLALGTHRQNMTDMAQKGRAGQARRDRLSPEIADAIYARFREGGITLTALARTYGLGLTTVWRIVHGAWTWQGQVIAREPISRPQPLSMGARLLAEGVLDETEAAYLDTVILARRR